MQFEFTCDATLLKKTAGSARDLPARRGIPDRLRRPVARFREPQEIRHRRPRPTHLVEATNARLGAPVDQGCPDRRLQLRSEGIGGSALSARQAGTRPGAAVGSIGQDEWRFMRREGERSPASRGKEQRFYLSGPGYRGARLGASPRRAARERRDAQGRHLVARRWRRAPISSPSRRPLSARGLGLAIIGALRSGFGAFGRFFDAVLQRSTARTRRPLSRDGHAGTARARGRRCHRPNAAPSRRCRRRPCAAAEELRDPVRTARSRSRRCSARASSRRWTKRANSSDSVRDQLVCWIADKLPRSAALAPERPEFRRLERAGRDRLPRCGRSRGPP